MSDQETDVAQDDAPPSEAGKILRFPDDRAAGVLHVYSQTGQRQTAAKGEIDVPIESHVVLLVPHEEPDGMDLPGFVPGDLSGVAGLEADSLTALVVAGDLDDRAFGSIAHLTGLKQLEFAGMLRFTEDGIAELSALENLESFKAQAQSMPAAVITGLPELPKVNTLALFAESYEGVSADDVVSMCKRMPELRRLQMPTEVGPLADMATVRALYAAEVDVNGTWLAPELADLFEKAPSPADVPPAPETPDEATAVKPLSLSLETLADEIAGDKPVLVDFWAEWCGPCRMIAPVIEALADELKESVTVAKVNTDENPDVWARFGISGIPTMLLFRKGEVIARLVGSRPREALLAYLQPLI